MFRQTGLFPLDYYILMKLSIFVTFELSDMHIEFKKSLTFSLDRRNFHCYTVPASKQRRIQQPPEILCVLTSEPESPLSGVLSPVSEEIRGGRLYFFRRGAAYRSSLKGADSFIMSEKKGFASWFLGKKKGAEPAPAEEPGVERLGSPLAGRVIPIEQVPDKVFADKVLGDGVAVVPEDGKVLSPADGTVENLLESCHAVCILTAGGAELLIHVGKDTVSLNGRHFAAHVKEGDKVRRGQLLLSFEREALLAEGFDLTTPVVVSNGDEFAMEKALDGPVRPGDTILTLTKKA